MQKTASQKKTKKQQVEATPVDPSNVVDPSAAADPLSVVDPSSVVDTSEKKKALPAIGNIHISRARCEWHFRNFISDNVIEQQIKALKELQKDNTNEEELKLNKAKIDELNKNLIRISQYTPHTIAIICDFVVKDIIKNGITQVINSGKKSLDISYFYMGESAQASYLYPLFKNLLSYIEGSKKVDEPPAKRKSKKKGEDVEEEDVQSAAEQHTDTEGEESVSNMSFNTYITNCISDVKKSFDTKITIGTKIKKYLSDLLIELIKRIALITKSLIRNVINVRTVAPNHIKAVIALLLLDGNISESNSDELLANIDEKLKLFQQAAFKETSKAPEVEVEEVKA